MCLGLVSCERVSWLPGTAAAGDSGTEDDCADAPTWTSFADGFLRTWCTTCHSQHLDLEARSGAPIGVDFDTWQGAFAWSDRIEARATGATPTMPPVGLPPDDEVARLAEWLRCGAQGEPTEPAPCTDPVTSSQVDCAQGWQIVEGTVLAQAGMDLDCLCGVDGDLHLKADMELPHLEWVTGLLSVDEPGLVILSLPALSSVGTLTMDHVDSLATVDLPSLTTASAINVRELPVLGSLPLPRLATVDTLHVYGSPSLHTLDLIRLQSFGSLTLDRLPALQLAPELTQLITAGDLWLIDTGIQSFTGPDVAMWSGTILVDANDHLAEIHGFDATVEISGNLELRNNDILGTVDGLTALQRIGGDLVAVDNPLLSSRELEALAERVDVSGTVTIEYNAP